MSAAEFSGREFSAGVVTGVRSFSVDRLGRLTGVRYPQVWVPDENVAECRRVAVDRALIGNLADAYLISMLGGGPVPSIPGRYRRDLLASPDGPHDLASCDHGFYAYFDGSDDYREDLTVSAVVQGYGEVLIGTRGFRAMKARIVALTLRVGEEHLSVASARRVKRNYPDVPVFSDFERMVTEFPPDFGLELSPATDAEFWTREL